jgi:hypothetical protein
MKKLFGLGIILTLFTASSCKKEGISIKFKMNYDAEFTIESGNILNLPLDFFTPDITTNSEAEFEANDTRKDKVQEIKMLKLDLTLTAPDGADFDFLKSIYLYINADGLDEKRIAFKENIADGLTVIVMNIDDVELAEYIKKDAFSLRAETVQDKTLSQDIDVLSEMQFQVKARAL